MSGEKSAEAIVPNSNEPRALNDFFPLVHLSFPNRNIASFVDKHVKSII